jgi:hypothetical protein
MRCLVVPLQRLYACGEGQVLNLPGEVPAPLSYNPTPIGADIPTTREFKDTEKGDKQARLAAGEEK